MTAREKPARKTTKPRNLSLKQARRLEKIEQDVAVALKVDFDSLLQDVRSRIDSASAFLMRYVDAAVQDAFHRDDQERRDRV